VDEALFSSFVPRARANNTNNSTTTTTTANFTRESERLFRVKVSREFTEERTKSTEVYPFLESVCPHINTSMV